jgi:ribosome maturation factor RimP
MIEDTLEQLLSPTIQDMGYELWGCEYLPSGRHSLLRVYIDKADGIGIGIEDCQEVSHRVGALLDVEDPIPGNYSLEISSPGIPRPLFRSWQYDRYIGQCIQVKTYKPVDGTRKLIGTIISASKDTLVLCVNEVQLEVPFSNIVKAHLT